MGQMFEPLFKACGYTVLVSGLDSSFPLTELVHRSEVVIISVPIDKTIEIIRKIAPLLTEGQLLSDFTSVKSEIVPEMLKTKARVISCHPIFGPMENIKGQNIVLCPTRPGEFQEPYIKLYETLGLNVELMEFEEHDYAMSFIQGLTHFIHIVFAQTLHSEKADIKKILSVCSPVYQANFSFLCRILSKDPHLYSCIQVENPKNAELLEKFIYNAEKSLALIKEKREAKFEENFRQYADYLGDFKDIASGLSDFLVEKLKEYNGGN